MFAHAVSLLGIAIAFAFFDVPANSRDVQVIFPKCIALSALPCSSYSVDITRELFVINKLPIKEKSYIYIMSSTVGQQVKIYDNDAVRFIYNIIGRAIETKSCKIVNIDASCYRSGRFIEITPIGYKEIILSINTELYVQNGAVDFSSCDKDDIDITSEDHI